MLECQKHLGTSIDTLLILKNETVLNSFYEGSISDMKTKYINIFLINTAAKILDKALTNQINTASKDLPSPSN